MAKALAKTETNNNTEPKLGKRALKQKAIDAQKSALKASFKLIEGTDNIKKAIDSVATRGKSLTKDIHIAAVSVLNHAEKHGDITLAQRLMDAMPGYARKNALRDYFLNFGKFGWDAEAKAFTFDRSKVTMLEDAIVTPYWEFQPEREAAPFDLAAALQSLIKRAENAAKKGQEVDAEVLEEVKKAAVIAEEHSKASVAA